MTHTEMICAIARTYGGWPHEVARWPFRYYLRVRNDLIQSWRDKTKAIRKATGGTSDDDRVIDMTPKVKR